MLWKKSKELLLASIFTSVFLVQMGFLNWFFFKKTNKLNLMINRTTNIKFETFWSIRNVYNLESFSLHPAPIKQRKFIHIPDFYLFYFSFEQYTNSIPICMEVFTWWLVSLSPLWTLFLTLKLYVWSTLGTCMSKYFLFK